MPSSWRFTYIHTYPSAEICACMHACTNLARSLVHVPAAAPAAPPAAMVAAIPPTAESSDVDRAVDVAVHGIHTDDSLFTKSFLKQLTSEAGVHTHEVDVCAHVRLIEPNVRPATEREAGADKCLAKPGSPAPSRRAAKHTWSSLLRLPLALVPPFFRPIPSPLFLSSKRHHFCRRHLAHAAA